MSTQTGRALRWEILTHPDDDDRRLVYADWLEETGSQSRADLIRVQLELEKLMPGGICPSCRNYGGPCNFCEVNPVADLQEQEKALLTGLVSDRSLFTGGWHNMIDMMPHLGWHCGNIATRLHEHEAPAVWFARGFIGKLRIRCLDWMRYGRFVMMTQPVADVKMIDKRPTTYVPFRDGGSFYAWYRGKHAHQGRYRACSLPEELWDVVARDDLCTRHGNWADFRDPIGALNALSRGAVNLMRRAAKVVIRCRWCAGDGRDSHEYEGLKCIECLGEGWTPGPLPEEPALETCTNCKGDGQVGWIANKGTVLCPTCSGAGFVGDPCEDE